VANLPMWRRTLIDADRRVGPLISQIQHSDEFATLVGMNLKIRRSVAQRATHLSRRLLHLVNLPAGSDVTRLLVQIASVEREVRELRKVVALRPEVDSEDVHRDTTATARRPREQHE
jgi:hypothetical protein